MDFNFVFGRSWSRWENNIDFNLIFLKQAEEYFNERLSTGYIVPLWEVLKYLGYADINIEPWMMLYGWGRIYKGSEDRLYFGVFGDSEPVDHGDYYVIKKSLNVEVTDNEVPLVFSGLGKLEVE